MITKQFRSKIKRMRENHADYILLFRNQDFYYAFYDDAQKVTNVINTELTKEICEKGEPIDCTHFPHCALDTYLPRLIRAGNRIAIYDHLD